MGPIHLLKGSKCIEWDQRLFCLVRWTCSRLTCYRCPYIPVALDDFLPRAIVQLPDLSDEGLDLFRARLKLGFVDGEFQFFPHAHHDSVSAVIFSLDPPSTIVHIGRRITRLLRTIARGSGEYSLAAEALIVSHAQSPR